MLKSAPDAFNNYLLGLGLALLAGTAAAQDNQRRGTVIKPKEQTSTVKAAAIDDERFELGAYLGVLSVEEFGTSPVAGLSFTYHISQRLIAEANHAQSQTDRATFEDVLGGNFLAEDDRDFIYQNLLAGYDLMQGRSFLGAHRKFNSHIYLLAGPARVSFAGQDNTGLALGITYKAVLTDWLVFDLDLRDTVVDREFLGNSKTTHNTEMTAGLNILF